MTPQTTCSTGCAWHTRGNPRALEAVKAILEGDETLTPRDLLDRTRQLPGDRVVQVLVGEAYELLDSQAQRVMQALSIFPAPVSAVGVDFLLRSADPTTDAAPILTRLVRRQMVRFQDARYYLHPLDREYARAQLPPGDAGDSRTAFTLTGLQARAADYYTQIRKPRQSWRTLEDLRPQLAEFELRCDTGDYDAAATVLGDIDFDYLQMWGHYRTLVELRGCIHGRITDPAVNANHLGSLGLCHFSLGDFGRAIDLHTQALAIVRETGDRRGEGIDLANQGLCHYSLGDFGRAIDLHTQALAIARETGDRQGDGRALANLGFCHFSLGDFGRAIDLHTQALAIARETGDRRGEGIDLANQGLCRFSVGDYQQAIDLQIQALAIARDIGYRYLEAKTLDYMGRAWQGSGDTRQAMTLLMQAASIADTTGDIKPAMEARLWLARVHLQLGDAAAALTVTAGKRKLKYPPEEPARRLLEGLALLELNRPGEGAQAFSDALAAADALLALADRNVAALGVRALALSGLAVVAADPARAAEAAEAFVRARGVTTAEGVVADTRRLLGIITAHDQSNVLTAIGS